MISEEYRRHQMCLWRWESPLQFRTSYFLLMGSRASRYILLYFLLISYYVIEYINRGRDRGKLSYILKRELLLGVIGNLSRNLVLKKTNYAQKYTW